MTASHTRHDLGVYNEACAFSLTSQSALERIIHSDHDVKELFLQRLVLAQELVQDAPFNARVVVHDTLMSDEDSWLGRATGILHIPCGKLLLCAGFDPGALYDYSKTGQGEFIHPIDVPAGNYQVDIYTYVNGINGGFCLPDTVKLGAWFRSSHPDTPFPLWLAAICEQEPEQDPGYKDLWSALEEATADGRLTLDTDPTALIDFVIQLRPLDKNVLLSSIDETEDGFFAPDVGARLPVQFPLGVRASTLPPNDYDMGILDEDDATDTDTSLTADPEFIHHILRNFGTRGIADLQDGPLLQPLDVFHQFAHLLWFCDSDADFVLCMQTPQGTMQNLAWPFAPDIPRPEGDDFQIGVTWCSVQQRTRAIQKICAFILTLPENSRIDFIAANEDPGLEAGRQCYQGVVTNHQWQITASHPPMSQATLQAALDLCREIDRPGPIYAATEAEARAIMEAADRSELFVTDLTRPHRNGAQITIDQDCKIALALLFFRQRFPHTWNVAEAQAQDEASKAEFDTILTDIEQSLAAPYRDDLIFAGKRSQFFHADINNVPQNGLNQALSALFQGRYPRHDVPEYLMSVLPSIESVDVVMHAMGFDLLGDMLCERSSDIVMRGYACVDSQTFAILMLGTSGQHGLDFYTRFDDSSSQTTSSLPNLDDLEEAGIFRTSYPNTDYQTLYTMHLQLVEQRTIQGAQVQEMTPTLEGLAADIDDFLQRRGV